MKIGIITLTGYYNYGNRFQNYALQTFLESLHKDIKVETIWYKKEEYIIDEPMITTKKLRRFVLNRHGYRDYVLDGLIYSDAIRQYNFKKFTDKFIHSVFCKNVDEKLGGQYDYFVVGSDQIWNPNYVKGKIEFLTFAPKEKRIAYAASLGVPRIADAGTRKKYANWLQEMKDISVREDAGASIIKELIGREVPVLLDPTMLLTKKHWQSISKEAYWYRGRKYLLKFFLNGCSATLNKTIEKFAQENDLEIIDLLDKRNIDYYTTSPEEFLWAVEHASLVQTDSFHATVFSIMLGAPFVNWGRKDLNMNSRIDTLLSYFHLEDRKGKEGNKNFGIISPLEIHYQDVEKILSVKREESRKYLLGALGIC